MKQPPNRGTSRHLRITPESRRVLAVFVLTASVASMAACSLIDLDGLTGGQLDAGGEPSEGSVRIVYITPDATTSMDAAPDIDAPPADASDGATTDAGADAEAAVDADAAIGDASADADAGAAYTAAVLADNPLAYWPMDEAAGSLAAIDVISGLRAAAAGNVTFGQVGAVGKAVRLDGASNLSPLGAFFDLYKSTPFAIEMWAKADNVDAGFENLSVETGSDGAGYVFYLRPGPQVQFEETWSGSQRVAWKTYTGTSDFDHLVITLDATNHIHIYANGIEATSAFEFNVDGGPTSDGGKTLLGSSIKGLIDEVAFYTHSLDETRVSAHYLARHR